MADVVQSVSDEAVLPIYEGETWEDAISAYAGLEQEDALIQLKKGAIVSSIETRYGEGSVKKFAESMDLSANSLYDYRSVHRKLYGLEYSDRSEILFGVFAGDLYYSYLLQAVTLPNHLFTHVLKEARDQGWKRKRLAEEVALIKSGLKGPEEDRGATESGYPLLDGVSEEERDRLAERQLELEARLYAPASSPASGPGEGLEDDLGASPNDLEQHTCPTCRGKGIILVTENGELG